MGRKNIRTDDPVERLDVKILGLFSRSMSRQLAALLGCSTAHVYLLCEQGKLPHSRDIRNAIRFDCKALGRVLRSTLTPDA